MHPSEVGITKDGVTIFAWVVVAELIKGTLIANKIIYVCGYTVYSP